jgi:hypothetical protein
MKCSQNLGPFHALSREKLLISRSQFRGKNTEDRLPGRAPAGSTGDSDLMPHLRKGVASLLVNIRTLLGSAQELEHEQGQEPVQAWGEQQESEELRRQEVRALRFRQW